MGLQHHIFIDHTDLLPQVAPPVMAFITLGKNYIHYNILQQDTKEQLFVKTLYTSDGNIGQDEFDSLLSDTLLRNASTVHLAIDTAKQLLIPTSLLSAHNHAIYFNHLYEIEKEEEIKTQQVSQEITELYVVKKASVSYLTNEFKQLKIYSHSACLLHTYFSVINQLKKSSVVFLHSAHDSFHISYFKNNELQYTQSFGYKTPADILYCVLNTLQWQQAAIPDVAVYLTGFSLQQQAIVDILTQYMEIDTLQSAHFANISFDIQHFPIPILFNQFSLISCVL